MIYRRYASLFFITSINPTDNELVTLEVIHRYVEVLDRYFGNVCELDLIFNFQKAYAVSISYQYREQKLSKADIGRAYHRRRTARDVEEGSLANSQLALSQCRQS